MTGRNSGGGTVTHIPPENWNDINLARTEKFDVYGFGVLLWEMFSERRPFQNCTLLVYRWSFFATDAEI